MSSALVQPELSSSYARGCHLELLTPSRGLVVGLWLPLP